MNMFKKTQYTVVLTLTYMLGIFSFFKECEIATSLAVFFVTIYLLFTNKIKKYYALIIAVVFILGLLYADFKMKEDDLLKSLAPVKVTLSGQVASIPTSMHKDKTKFFLNVSHADTGIEQYETKSKTFVTINDSKENYKRIKIGDELKVQAKLRIPQDATNPSQFSYRNYLKNFNTFTTAYVTQNGWEITSSPKDFKSKFIQNLNILRQKIIAKHNKIIKSPNIEILGGIVFGDDAISPPEDVKDSFIHSGLMHILAASGLNVALIFGIWFFIFSKLRIHYKTGITIGIFLILFYTMMTGLGPPVLRAALMLTFALIGKLIDRDADNVALLLLVAAIILIYNPAYLFDVGFQLSFVVTLGLLKFCPLIAEKTKNIPQSIAGAVYVPIVAQLMVAPIQMYYFNTFALYSLFANIVSLPFVSAISFLGFTSSILAMIPKFPSIIVSIFDYIMNPILTALVAISNFFANLPNSLLTTTQCNLFQIVIYYVLVVILYLWLKNGFAKKTVIAFISVLIFLLFTTISFKNDNLEAIFFNVGNADAILVKTPENKYIVIDTAHTPYQGGFSQAKAIVYEYLKDNGIKELEYLIITHYDSDHAGGAVELMKLIKIKNIILNSEKYGSGLAERIETQAKEKGINIIYANEPMVYAYKDGNMQVFSKLNTNDSNNSSINTIFSKNGKTMLFTGDSALKITEKFNLPENIDVLKIAHHGAEHTTNKNFLISKHVKVAVLSTGPNSYGHPVFETIFNLQNSNVKILRTDTHNAIKTVITDSEIKTFAFDNKTKKWKNVNKKL